MNTDCRYHYVKQEEWGGKINEEEGCMIHQDIEFCSNDCAYATNTICSSKVKRKPRDRRTYEDTGRAVAKGIQDALGPAIPRISEEWARKLAEREDREND